MFKKRGGAYIIGIGNIEGSGSRGETRGFLSPAPRVGGRGGSDDN